MNNYGNLLLVGSREQTQKKALEIIMEKIEGEENLIVTDTVNCFLYHNTIAAAYEHGYRVVRLDPYAKKRDSVNIMQTAGDGDEEKLCGTFPEYLLGEMFIGEPEEYIPPSRYAWSYEVIHYMVEHKYGLSQINKFFKENPIRSVVDKLYDQEPQLMSLIGSEPPWRIADDLSDIQNTFTRRLSAKREVEMLSESGYDMSMFGQEKTIVYIVPMPECRLTPLVIERILALNENSRIPCTVVMDEGSCIREPYGYDWNVTTNYLLMIRTDQIPSGKFLKESCKQTCYCA